MRVVRRTIAAGTTAALGLVGFAALGLGGFGTPAHADAGQYVALGDSYSSGVGTREYYSDSGSCKRSPYAYPVLDAAQLGADLSFDACSGATTDSVLSGQLGDLSASTAYVTISVGGNDAGFTSVLTKCAEPWPWTCWGKIDDAEAFIRDQLPGRLDAVYSAISDRAPNARVVVVGYPRLFNGEQCGLLPRISPGEQARLNEAADLLSSTTADRAAAHGFAFVDVRPAFDGHAVCDDPEWINGLSDPISESYHPNRAGQSQGYAPLVGSALAGTLSTAAARS